MSDKIPPYLIEQIKTGNAILFLGAGASMESIHSENKKIPTGQQLSALIAKKFLGDGYENKDLQYVSELAISESSLYHVQNFIHDVFVGFKPGNVHLKIPLFKWHTIFTTNYDLVIEEAYNNVNSPTQQLVKFVRDGQKIIETMSERNSLMYIKLHGCIDEIKDQNIPLILTTDQYIDHKKFRTKLFDRLEEFGSNYPIIFVGYSLADSDIRAALKLLGQNIAAQQRHYIVAPNISEADIRLWEGKKVSAIKMTFAEFMTELEMKISPAERLLGSLRQATISHPLEHKFINGSKEPTASLFEFLEKDVDYIHSNLASKSMDPKLFYKGLFTNWDPILKNLDVKRDLTDAIISEIIIIDEDDRTMKQDLYVIDGNAGSGKSVLLHRLAYEAGTIYEKLCIVYKSQSAIDFNRLREIWELCNERIFLFIENAHERVEDVLYLITKAQKENISITVILTERTNILNTLCEDLLPYIQRIYSLTYLAENELNDLIKLLEIHKSLGYLESKSEAERKEALANKAGRELLVALYEATQGKNLADIVMDEYNKIPNEEAQQIYLSICTFHRIGAYTRAGNLARLHNINFSYFQEKLFKPLESVIYNKRDYRINDFVFVTRHPYIAEIVFEHVLVGSDERYNKYIEVLSKLDNDYESDALLFKDITNAKKLLETFPDNNKIRSIYSIARRNIGNDPYLLQQESIFEMRANDGDFSRSEELLNEAEEVAPDNLYFYHTRAELYLKKAEKQGNPILRNQFIKKCREICNEIIQKFSVKNLNISATYHTLLKLYILELKFLLQDEDNSQLDKKIQDFEKVFLKASQEYPKETFFLDAESKFNEIMEQHPLALISLVKAFELNNRSPYLATRLANYYKENNIEKAIEILQEAIKTNQYDKNLNFVLAKLLLIQNPEDYLNHRHYLRASFTKNDKRYEAQFWYARCLYLLEEFAESAQYFDYIKLAPLNFKIKKELQGPIVLDGTIKEFEGKITKLERSYGFLKQNITGESFYFSRNPNEKDGIHRGSRVIFNKYFNYTGPVAKITQILHSNE